MKKLLLFSILLFCPFHTKAQNNSDLEKQVVSKLTEQLLAFPQEKIHIQTDKPYYICGEKIFFRAFLLHASLNAPIHVSRYVYVELINPLNESVLLQQIRVDDDNLFYGALALPEDLPEGNYRIRSYTRFMENVGEEWFYSQSVFIASPNSAKIEMESKFDFFNDKQVGVALRFKDRKNESIKRPENVELTLEDNKSTKIVPNEEGWITQKFNLKDSDTKRTLLIDYNNGNGSFSKYIQIPYQNNLPEISFYPEGGNLIVGQTNRVAFKALLPDGSSAEIKGTIFNNKEEIQTTFSTFHAGMGDFSLDVRENETYYAQINYNDEVIKINLPKNQSNTLSLQAILENEKLSVSVNKPISFDESTCYLLIHHQGVPNLFEEWDFSKNKKTIHKNQFKTGVSHLLLLNKNLQIVSEIGRAHV